jgi:hypothetical protein
MPEEKPNPDAATDAAAATEAEPEADEDVVLLHSPTDDGEGIRVIRSRTGRPLEAGEVRAMKEGKPITGGEVVSLKPRAGAPRLCDVEVVAQMPKAAGGAAEPRAVTHGPAQVATDAYRASWERTFRRSGKGAPN